MALKRIALFLAANPAIVLHPAPLPDRMAAFGIAGGGSGGLKRLFMTHPPIEARIATLEAGTAEIRR